jgi:hypothetical protein
MHPRLAAAKQADAMTAMQEKLPVIEQNQIAMQAQLDRIEALLKSAVEAEPEAEEKPAPVGLEKPTSKKADKA